MKILFISHASILDAYRAKLKELAKYPDIEITLLVPNKWKEASQNINFQSTFTETDLYKIISGKILFKNHIARYFYPALSKYIRDIKPNIIHIEEEPFSLCTFHATLLRKNSKILFFTWENIKRRYKFPLPIFERYVLKNSDYAICGNREAKDVLVNYKGFSKNVRIIPQMGVNSDIFKRINVGNLEEKLGLVDSFVIGYVGRLVKEKGILLLIEACARLNARFKLLIIGNGRLKDEILMLSNKLGIGNKVILIDTIPHEKLPEYINCMDVLVLPSQTTSTWKEQFGRVLIEAMACEVAVIGSSSGAIPEVISDAGLLFKEGNINDLREKLYVLIEDNSLKENLAKKGKNHILKNYTNKIIAQKIYKIYQELYEKVQI